MRGAKRGAAGAEIVLLEGLAASACRPKCPLDIGFPRSACPGDLIEIRKPLAKRGWGVGGDGGGGGGVKILEED